MPGKKKKNVMRTFKIGEISAVDNPAQEGARALIMKRADIDDNGDVKPTPDHQRIELTPEVEKQIKRTLKKRKKGDDTDHDVNKGGLVDFLTDITDGHQHGIELNCYDGEVYIYVGHALAEGAEDSHSHDVSLSADGGYVLSTVAGHTHAIDQQTFAGRIIAITVAKTDDNPTGGNPMPSDDKKAQETIEKLQGDLTASKDREAATQKKLDRLEKVTSLSADHRAHFDTLTDESAQEAFLEKSADERTAEITAIKKAQDDADPVEYTSADGEVFRKSDDPRLIKQARQIDAINKRNDDLEKQAKDEKLEKRAETELQHLPGDIKVRKALLGAIDGIEDEEIRKEVLKSVQAKDKALGQYFKELGHNGDDPEGDDTPEEQLHKLAMAKAEKDKIPFHEAYTKVAQSPEGQAIYKRTLDDPETVH